jgi:hypothetical protein
MDRFVFDLPGFHAGGVARGDWHFEYPYGVVAPGAIIRAG